MDRTSVTSSMISSIGYDADSQLLEIEFNKGGTYQYNGVPQGEYETLMGADSHGKYFLANIKDRYPTSKL